MGEKELRSVGVVSDMVASTKRGLGSASECMMLAGDKKGAKYASGSVRYRSTLRIRPVKWRSVTYLGPCVGPAKFVLDIAIIYSRTKKSASTIHPDGWNETFPTPPELAEWPKILYHQIPSSRRRQFDIHAVATWPPQIYKSPMPPDALLLS